MPKLTPNKDMKNEPYKITYENTEIPSVQKWTCGPYTGKVYIAPYNSPNKPWATFDDDPNREILQKEVIQQAQDRMAGQ
jgi:hypothetical protein|tara:strand:- start:673 stop:909 length:237 start_codon:yes stop_codon:yes gene_type:complete